MQIVDPLNNGRSQGFCYDNLNRISLFSNGDGSMQESYTIDPWGNMKQSGTETLQVGYDNHNRITDNGFDYDFAGNMTQSDFGFPATFAYDAMGQITNYDNGGATYTYDGGGNRVRKDVSGAWTEYVYFDGQPMAEKNSDGSWSDYIFANGQRIAQADSYDERIHTHGTSGGTGEYASWHLALDGYVVKTGDKISWRQYETGGGIGGVLIGFTDNSTANWDTYDQNGQMINSATTQDQWMERTVDLSAFAGKTISTLGVVTDAQTGACTWDIYYSDMAIVSTDGTVTPIYDRESAVSLSYYNSAGITNATAAAERSNTADDAEQPANSTTYYIGDQIGSERMLLAAGGWPLSSDTYYPYGTEATPSAGANHYKFTGKERDYASGNDYFGARYYSSNMGRFMSPDPLGGHMENPQSLNKYAYALNNPLKNTDPTGLDSYLQCTSTKDNASTCQSERVGGTDKNPQMADVQGVTGKNGFTATRIGNNPDGSGGLVDLTTGTGSYTASVNGSGVQFSNDGGQTSSSGVYVNGTPNNTFQDAGFANGGALSGFTFTLTNSKMEANQTEAGTFTFAGTPEQAGQALLKAGFYSPLLGENVGQNEYRSLGSFWTGSNSTHVNVDQINLAPRGSVPSAGGDFHTGEHNLKNPIAAGFHCFSDHASVCSW